MTDGYNAKMEEKPRRSWSQRVYQFRLVFWVAGFMAIVGVFAWHSPQYIAPSASTFERIQTVLCAWLFIPIIGWLVLGNLLAFARGLNDDHEDGPHP